MLLSYFTIVSGTIFSAPFDSPLIEPVQMWVHKDIAEFKTSMRQLTDHVITVASLATVTVSLLLSMRAALLYILYVVSGGIDVSTNPLSDHLK